MSHETRTLTARQQGLRPRPCPCPPGARKHGASSTDGAFELSVAGSYIERDVLPEGRVSLRFRLCQGERPMWRNTRQDIRHAPSPLGRNLLHSPPAARVARRAPSGIDRSAGAQKRPPSSNVRGRKAGALLDTPAWG